MTKLPIVSVGMPVYNGESTLASAIESILSQTFSDLELIISDNASTDKTEEICRDYAARDSRIRYIRQPTNTGPENNFKYVLDQSVGQYFMWAADDDTRTPGFIEANLGILEANADIVFSSSPNCFMGQENKVKKHKCFELRGTLYQRFIGFLDVGLISHGCFYSLMRRDVIKDVPDLSTPFLAWDWILILYMLLNGNFARCEGELLIIDQTGTCFQEDFLKKMRKRHIELLFPFFEFSIRFIDLVKDADELSFYEKVLVILKIVKFNFAFILTHLIPKALKFIR